MAVFVSGQSIWYALSYAIVAFPIGGYFWALFTWASVEKAYNRDMSAADDD